MVASQSRLFLDKKTWGTIYPNPSFLLGYRGFPLTQCNGSIMYLVSFHTHNQGDTRCFHFSCRNSPHLQLLRELLDFVRVLNLRCNVGKREIPQSWGLFIQDILIQWKKAVSWMHFFSCMERNLICVCPPGGLVYTPFLGLTHKSRKKKRSDFIADFGTWRLGQEGAILHSHHLTFYGRKMLWSQSDVSSTSPLNTWISVVLV